MNAKSIFTILFATLALSVFSSEPTEYEKRSDVQFTKFKSKTPTRSLIYFDLSVSDRNNHLQIVFYSFLSNSDICITDANGNVVAFDSNVNIYDGMVITIPVFEETAYPYYVEVTSPTLDIEAEITLKQSN